ncbi:hypothetical protein DFH09DRAFT_1353513 [Mycena vulgaris]|nr:hypothetical protein DFH09DRAFT_1353513 [Mycena vulgaris]
MPPKRKRNVIAGPSTNTRARRLVKKEPDSDEDMLKPKVEPDSDDVVPKVEVSPRRNPRRGAKRPKLEDDLDIAPSAQETEDEDESEPAPARRRKLPRRATSESEGGEDPETPRPPRIHRKGDSEEEDVKVPAGDGLDSDADSADVDDLELPAPPSPSKPTPRELKRQAFQRYTKTRNTKPSPTSARKNVVEAAENCSAAVASEDDSDSDETGTESSATQENLDNSDSSLIDDEDEDQTADAALEVDAALGPERCARRTIEEQLAVFVEYVVRLRYEPNLLSLDTTTENDKLSYRTAISSPAKTYGRFCEFHVTFHLVRAPTDCQACWTRGPFECSGTGSCTLSTLKGFYDRDGDTFQETAETNVEYCKETTEDFENSADAPKLPYPPGFRLVVGARCSRRAAAYHQARHYMYRIATRVRDEVESLCDRDADLSDDQDALVEALDGGFIRENMLGTASVSTGVDEKAVLACARAIIIGILAEIESTASKNAPPDDASDGYEEHAAHEGIIPPRFRGKLVTRGNVDIREQGHHFQRTNPFHLDGKGIIQESATPSNMLDKQELKKGGKESARKGERDDLV